MPGIRKGYRLKNTIQSDSDGDEGNSKSYAEDNAQDN